MTRRAFTLVEVVTSTLIALVLVVLATSIFLQMRGLLRRTQARLEMHNAARFIFQSLRHDFSSMQQEGAFYLETTADSHPELPPGDPGHTGEVRLTFLRGKVDNNDYNPLIDNILLNTDLIWTQWDYHQATNTLSSGSNIRSRGWWASGHWQNGSHDFGNAGWGHYYLNLPQPRRTAGVSAQVRLNDNTFGSGDPGDYGDYADVMNALRPINRTIIRLEMQMVYADGSVVSANVDSNLEQPSDGAFVDGHVPDISSPLHKRPRLLRLRFVLQDQETNSTQSFSFSFPAPGPLPSL